MRITLESTDVIQTIMRGVGSAKTRVWVGSTDDGIPVKAWIATISPQTHDEAANQKFGAELEELTKDSRPAAIDLRFIL